MSKISAWLWQQQYSGGASDQVFFLQVYPQRVWLVCRRKKSLCELTDKCLELINTIHGIVKVHFADLQRALYGMGNFELHEHFKRHYMQYYLRYPTTCTALRHPTKNVNFLTNFWRFRTVLHGFLIDKLLISNNNNNLKIKNTVFKLYIFITNKLINMNIRIKCYLFIYLFIYLYPEGNYHEYELRQIVCCCNRFRNNLLRII
jgi:hypothetical protein